MTAEKILDYMNISDVIETITDIYKGVRDNFTGDDNRAFMENYYDDATLEEEATCIAIQLNDDMKRYLHAYSHKIVDNFKILNLDYKGDLNDLIARLDADAHDEQTETDRQWLTDWFWDTFGIFGVRYNFESALSDALYKYAKELEG